MEVVVDCLCTCHTGEDFSKTSINRTAPSPSPRKIQPGESGLGKVPAATVRAAPP